MSATPRAFVFGGTDGHGAAMTALTIRNLEAEGYQVDHLCRFPATGQVGLFWTETLSQTDLTGVGLVVIVDIPMPNFDQRYPDAGEKGLSALAAIVATGTRVVLIDHHKSSESLIGRAVEAGVQVIINSSATSCFLGDPNVATWQVARIGAIADRDESTLPVQTFEEMLAEQLDSAVRGNFQKDGYGLDTAIAALAMGDLGWLQDKPGLPSLPVEPAKNGNIAILSDSTPTYAFKQAANAAEAVSADYGLAADYRFGAAITAVTYWKSNALPVAMVLGQDKFMGHGEAIVIPLSQFTKDSPLDERKAAVAEKMAQLAATINAGGNGGTSINLFSFASDVMGQARIPVFLTRHTWAHVRNVISHSQTMGSAFNLKEREMRILRFAAALHDVGNGAGAKYGVSDSEARARHHEFSRDMVLEWGDAGLFEGVMTPAEVETVAFMCLAHRKKVALPNDPELRKLVVLLRVADGLDITRQRAQANDEGVYYEDLLPTLPAESIPHWEGHRSIEALRIHLTAGKIVFEFIVSNAAKARFQVDEFTAETKPLREFVEVEIKVTEIQ